MIAAISTFKWKQAAPKAAAHYPMKLCMVIVQGLKDRIRYGASGMASPGRLSSVKLRDGVKQQLEYEQYKDNLHEEAADQELIDKELALLKGKHGTEWATGDVTGAASEPELVKKARDLELQWFKKPKGLHDDPKIRSSRPQGHQDHVA